MILIGMFDSPFVRRVAVSRDFELIRQYNPLGRVPALVQADGEVLIDSSAILDFLDFLDAAAGSERALLPPSGDERRRALQLSVRCEGLPAFSDLQAKFTPNESALPREYDRAAR